MGGAIGGVLGVGGTVLSTAASLLENDSAERAYYRSMAKMAEEQARQIEENARRNATYIMQEAGYQNKQLAEDYNSLIGNQKTMLAANGVTGQSATAQLILKNSRLNAQLDQEMLAQNLNRSISETTTSAALQAQQQRNQAKQYRRAANKIDWWGHLGNTMMHLFGGK